jgi:hypothetical protein
MKVKGWIELDMYEKPLTEVTKRGKDITYIGQILGVNLVITRNGDNVPPRFDRSVSVHLEDGRVVRVPIVFDRITGAPAPRVEVVSKK